MRAHRAESQATITPARALEILREGNARFRGNLKANRDLLQQVNETRTGQWPFAVILSCMDSRTSAELVFDQGLGDILSVRVAGNFANDDIIGSMEFGCRVLGAKLILVLGHSHCGAIKGACDGVRFGLVTSMLDRIRPAVDRVLEPRDTLQRTSVNEAFVSEVAVENIRLTMNAIRERSPILRQLDDENQIDIVGGMYCVETGEVDFILLPNGASSAPV